VLTRPYAAALGAADVPPQQLVDAVIGVLGDTV
jgi:hypothetical protein